VQRFVGRRGGVDELRHAVGAAPVHAVQDQAVKVNVQVGSRAKALNQSDRAAIGFVRLEPSLAEQVPRDHAVHHLQHGRHQLGLCSQPAPWIARRAPEVVSQHGLKPCRAPQSPFVPPTDV
jgi:hypothetical protein